MNGANATTSTSDVPSPSLLMVEASAESPQAQEIQATAASTSVRSSAPAPTVTRTTTTTTTTTTSSNATASDATCATACGDGKAHGNCLDLQLLDFIGTSHAVKGLFSLPYAPDRAISVGIHNLQGTLLLDADPGYCCDEDSPNGFLQPPPPRVCAYPQQEIEAADNTSSKTNNNNPPNNIDFDDSSNHDSMTSIVAVSSQQPAPHDALSVLEAMIQDERNRSTRHLQKLFVDQKQQQQQQQHQQLAEHLDPTLSYSQRLPKESQRQMMPAGAIPTEPREYLQWAFHDMKLLVGSDAMIYRSADNNSTAHSLTVRVENAADLREQLEQHRTMVKAGTFQPDHSLEQWQQTGRRSYAQALRTRRSVVVEEEEEDETKEEPSPLVEEEDAAIVHSPPPSFAVPDLERVKLQTCIVPSTKTLSSGVAAESSPLTPTGATTTTSSSSPVCTVLDAYLDNIMANVPQLALCLREKGFVQSVKLIRTDQIPSGFMQEMTFDTSTPFEVINGNRQQKPSSRGNGEDIFSPQIMDMNASTLLRFLKANCTTDNATYLLRREAGQSNIQLYDVSAISKQRQRKWIWWLAMMSYRFSQRLRHMSLHSSRMDSDVAAAMRRTFRARQRSLLQNTLNLLEEFADMDGPSHETFVAEVCEQLAETFLRKEEEVVVDDKENSDVKPSGPGTPAVSPHTAQYTPPAPAPSSSAVQQRYSNVTVDALNKANDHLNHGIKILWRVWQKLVADAELKRSKRKQKIRKRRRNEHRQQGNATVVSVNQDSSSSGSEADEDDTCDIDSRELQAEAVSIQLLSLHDKTISVLLRLADHHLNNYFSSSAMQSVRTAARRIAAASSLLHPLTVETRNSVSSVIGDAYLKQQMLLRWTRGLQLHYTRLWECCGHFARSFAADEHWRDRGHACGDDVVSVLREVEAAFNAKVPATISDTNPSLIMSSLFSTLGETLSEKTRGMVSLQNLSAIVDTTSSTQSEKALQQADLTVAARDFLDAQQQLKRDRRRVLVAACVSYDRAVLVSRNVMDAKRLREQEMVEAGLKDAASASKYSCEDMSLINLLRFGDSCNETGKILLTELRTLLAEKPGATADKNDAQSVLSNAKLAAMPLLSSAEFWFLEGLEAFEKCKDLRNAALLRCNLCQCYKLRANSNFDSGEFQTSKDVASHAENCLQKAAEHLLAAHEALGQRDVDPKTWDMVSDELAATWLVLGVRRRQSLLGRSNTPCLFEALRLSPGNERSIVDPMDKALKIYEQSGNVHQAAATHYQLALFYSKVWTCQRDETKTREKLSAAFQHYSAAHAYFSRLQGIEPTFVLLCLDLSNLYAAVSGEECLCRALLCCFDTLDSFSQETIDRWWSNQKPEARDEWLEKMKTLASSVEERLFKLLRSLVKHEETTPSNPPGKYKDLYRAGLTAKMTNSRPSDDESHDNAALELLAIHKILKEINSQYDLTAAP